MATYNELEQQYQQERASRESLDSVRSRLEKELGLSDQRKRVGDINRTILDTERLLEGVDPRVAQRARQLGGPVTEGTRQRLVEVQRRPLIQDISKLSRAEETARVGADSLEKDLLAKLGIINQDRNTADMDWQRRIGQALSQEQQAAALSANAYQGYDPNDIQAMLDTLMGGSGGLDLSAIRARAAQAGQRAGQQIGSNVASRGRNVLSRLFQPTKKSGGVRKTVKYASKRK